MVKKYEFKQKFLIRLTIKQKNQQRLNINHLKNKSSTQLY